MDYISFIPIELIELIIPYLDNDGLVSFLKYHDVKNFINWTTVYTLHFNKIRNVNYGLYFSFLSIEMLRCKFNLKENVEEIYNLKVLDLTRGLIKEIPPEIEQLINLEGLHLNHNEIIKISKEIGKLTNLQYLDLSYNKIKDIPETVGNLTNLKELHLDNNQIKGIPETVEKLINLQFLTLHNKLDNNEKNKLRSLLLNTHFI